MSEVVYVHKPLEELFDYKPGCGEYTKAFCNERPGNFIVYTASTTDIFAKVDFYDYEEDNLSFVTDGYAGKVDILTGNYSVGGHRGLLIAKAENICLLYFKYILEPIFIKNVKPGSVPSVSWNQLKNVKVPIPVNDVGEYNYDIQEAIANKLNIFDEKKNIILNKIKELENILIRMDDTPDIDFKSVALESIFDLSKGSNGSDFTKSFIKAHPGGIPVYGASKFENEVSYGYVADNVEIEKTNKNGLITKKKVKYFQDCLTYNIDGTAGYIYYRRGRFSLSEKVKPLILFDEYQNSIDAIYIKYTLQPFFRDLKKGREGHNGQNEFSKLSSFSIKNIKIPIPINKNGEFDIETQKFLANKYLKIEEIKDSLIKKLQRLIELKVDVTEMLVS